MLFTAEGLTGGVNYGIKIQAQNDIGASEDSDIQYFTCADLPDPPVDPPTLESSSKETITISWNAPVNDGGSPIIGFAVYFNDLTEGNWY